MIKESSVSEQNYIFVIQTRDENLEELVSDSVKGKNIRFKSVKSSADVTEHAQGQIITFIIGSDIEDPVQSAQRLHALEENARIILLAKSDESKNKYEKSLRFSPFIGTNVYCLNESNESELENFSKILQDSVKAEKYRAIIADSNSIISSSVSSQKKVVNQHFINKLMEIAPIGIAIVSREGKVLGWNKEATSIFEENEAQILGSHIQRFFNRTESNKLKAFLSKCVEESMATDNTETVDLERKTKGSSRQILSLTAAPFMHSEDPERILVLAIKNITEEVLERRKREEIQENYTRVLEEKIHQRTLELKKANTNLHQKVEELVNINKELDKFAYVASHDLQEPLRKIIMFADRISEKEKNTISTKGKKYLGLMQDATDRMKTLIEDLLSFSRLATSERKYERTDLHSIIDEVIDLFREVIKEKNAIIETDVQCEADIVTFQFRQLMHNLIGNALKFSKPGEAPSVSIKCRMRKGSELNFSNVLPDVVYCHLSVADKGIGFEDEYSNKIFEVFQRLHSRDEYPGTGIGLATVQKIVEIHQGNITATSELNKGTTFDIYLPAHHNT